MNTQDSHIWYQPALLQYFLKDDSTNTQILKKNTAEYFCTKKYRVLALANFQRNSGSDTEHEFTNSNTFLNPKSSLITFTQL